MKSVEFKIFRIDQGFCQITYVTKNDLGQKIYYCLQDNGPNHGGVRLLRATQPPWCEPNYEIKGFLEIIPIFEKPTGDSELEKKCRDWILEQEKGGAQT